MENFVTDNTAKRVLRGVIRDTSMLVPSDEEIYNFMLGAISSSRNGFKPAIDRIREWSKKWHVAVLSQVVKRNISVCIVVPMFSETDMGWILTGKSVGINFSNGKYVPYIVRAGLSFTGHALERFFQRGRLISWGAVIEEYKTASKCGLILVDLVLQDAQQLVIPSSNGIYLGKVANRLFLVKTFLPKSNKFDPIKTDIMAIISDMNLSLAYEKLPWRDRQHLELRVAKLIEDHPILLQPYEPYEYI